MLVVKVPESKYSWRFLFPHLFLRKVLAIGWCQPHHNNVFGDIPCSALLYCIILYAWCRVWPRIPKICFRYCRYPGSHMGWGSSFHQLLSSAWSSLWTIALHSGKFLVSCCKTSSFPYFSVHLHFGVAPSMMKLQRDLGTHFHFLCHLNFFSR